MPGAGQDQSVIFGSSTRSNPPGGLRASLGAHGTSETALNRPRILSDPSLYPARDIICQPKCITLYARALHNATHLTFDKPRTRNGAKPRSVFSSALTVSIVD